MKKLSEIIKEHADNCLNANTARFLNDDALEIQISIHHFLFIIHYNLDSAKPHKPLDVNKQKEPLLPPYPEHRLCEHYKHHYIFINKNMLCPGHVVISADSKDCHKVDMLNIDDFDALSHVICGFDGIGIGYYNCGIDSGCSQYHKHLQYVPFEQTPILDSMINHEKLPFRFYIQKIESYEPQLIEQAYFSLFNQLDKGICYNFICSKKHVVLIPRRTIKTPENIVINSLGYCGHIITRKEYVTDSFNPLDALISTGFPTNEA